jgi:3-hydroxyacyl-CoA dehydrogenase
VQLVGKRWNDSRLLAVAKAISLTKTTWRPSFAIGASVTDIDVAMLDLGTPMSPLRLADTGRIAIVFCQLSRRAGVAGRHYASLPLLKRMSESGGKFYAGG